MKNNNTNTKFLREFIFNLGDSPSTLIYVSKYYLTKALNKLFKQLESKNQLVENQVIGIILQVKFSDGSIKSMSTFRRGTIKNKSSFSTLFKHLLSLRSNDYNARDYKVVELILKYHIYPLDYILKGDELSVMDRNMLSTDKNHIEYKEEQNIKYMDTLPYSSFKLPLTSSVSSGFVSEFMRLNTNTSDNPVINDKSILYRIIINKISQLEADIKIVSQQDNEIVEYQFKDKLITVPKLDRSEILIERSVITDKIHHIFLIDSLASEIIFISRKDLLKYKKGKGFIKSLKIDEKFNKESLRKFITFDLESINDLGSLNENGDVTWFKPIMISAYDFFRKINYFSRFDTDHGNIPVMPNTTGGPGLRSGQIRILKEFFNHFISKKYDKYVLYAHNLSSFDGVLILESLVYLCEENGYKLDPCIKDNSIKSITIKFGLREKGRGYRYSITFHDSLLLLLTSLDKLSKTFLKDHPELQKMDNKKLLEYLLYEDVRVNTTNEAEILSQLELYCERDSLALAYIIESFANMIYERFKLNIHDYMTLSSLALAIYRSNYLKSDELIPIISGSIYKDISKAYHGGHTDVYGLYSKEDVHSYDYSSMYPAQMFKHPMPTGKIDKFEGNPLNIGETLESLKEKLAFIKCSVFVDKSLNRPLYQTTAEINGEIRSVCATGTFKNQWVFVPELLYYEELTKGKIRIIPESIEKGYLFESTVIFKDYINDLYLIKNSVTKDDPWYLISKILMNSLYGRMGLRQELTEYSLMPSCKVEDFSIKCGDSETLIKDVLEFDSCNSSLVITSKDSDQVELKSSVAIAAAITAYARMELAPILLDESLDIMYIDTDSYKCKQKITDLERYKHLDHDGLGALKYEETYSESLFLIPKVYGGIIKESNKEFVKVKGFKNKIEFDQLKELLFKNQKLELSQNKWHRNILKSEIKIMKSPYCLSLNENKRINNLETFKTTPHHFDEYDPQVKK